MSRQGKRDITQFHGIHPSIDNIVPSYTVCPNSKDESKMMFKFRPYSSQTCRFREEYSNERYLFRI